MLKRLLKSEQIILKIIFLKIFIKIRKYHVNQITNEMKNFKKIFIKVNFILIASFVARFKTEHWILNKQVIFWIIPIFI